MDAAVIVVIVVVVVLAIVAAVAAYVMSIRRRRARLQEQFGPEWERALQTKGSPKAAESELRNRIDRRQHLDIRPLHAEDRERYQGEWQQIQNEFVDHPAASLTLAHGLVTRVMHDSGYPMEDFDGQADIVSVDHPDVVEHYRRAHQTFLNNQQGEASTEDMRQALVSYRQLFSDLLGDAPVPDGEFARQTHPQTPRSASTS
jgi:hypothetical protein